MNEWIEELSDLAAAGEPAVLVTVAGIRGSSPREMGAKMIVTRHETIGTIGGGQLEYQSSRVAVDMLDGNGADRLGDRADVHSRLRSFPLGSAMGQCCGGVVEILFEPVLDGMPRWLSDLRALHGQNEAAMLATRISTTAPQKLVVSAARVFAADEADPLAQRAQLLLRCTAPTTREVQEFFEPVVAPNLNIAVFGAGHVGAALVATLSRLDCNIRWIDSRRNVFRDLPANVRAIEAPQPALEVAALPSGSFYLVMTHSHALDFEICDRILRRNDAAYCGLIGSRSKRRRFEKRYRQQGMSQALLDKLTCPIGVDGISGKKPAEIAVAATAEVLRVHERAESRRSRDLPDNVHPIRG